MNRSRLLAAAVALSAISASSLAQTLNAHPGPTNNGLSAFGAAIFFDLTSLGPGLTITEMTTASNRAAGLTFNIEVLTFVGSGLGGPVGSGPGSSPTGWTSLGTALATQGAVSNHISLPINIPDIVVGAGQTVGVAVRFLDAGPRYFGTGTPPMTAYSDANLTLLTGQVRSTPFTTGGSWFSSRELVGSVTYVVPEPATVVAIGLGCLGLALARRKRS